MDFDRYKRLRFGSPHAVPGHVGPADLDVVGDIDSEYVARRGSLLGHVLVTGSETVCTAVRCANPAVLALVLHALEHAGVSPERLARVAVEMGPTLQRPGEKVPYPDGVVK